MKYNCPRCGYETNISSRMEEHIGWSVMCEVKIRDVNIKNYKKEIMKGGLIDIDKIDKRNSLINAINDKDIILSFDRLVPNNDYCPCYDECICDKTYEENVKVYNIDGKFVVKKSGYDRRSIKIYDTLGELDSGENIRVGI